MDDQTLIREFETQTLPFDQWTHRTHVKVAYTYLTTFPFDEAMDRIRVGIKAYNAANDVPEGPNVGYHETMTAAWVRLIDFCIKSYGPYDSADAFFDDQPQLCKKQVLRFFYSKQRFMSPEAKTSFLEPDITPLPVCRHHSSANV